jgi:hypothetical protein
MIKVPELNIEQKFAIRDAQLRLANTNEGIRTLNQRVQTDNALVRSLLEGVVTAAGLAFEQVSFDLDSLTFNEVPAAPAPVAPAPVAIPAKRGPKPRLNPPTL